MLNEASWLLNSWLQDVQNLTKFFVCTNCRERSVKTNPNWMHKSNTLELVSWWVQQQKQEDKCKPKWQCKCKNGSECYRSFFCDHNNNRLLEIDHNPKEGLNKNSNLLSHHLRVVESAALEDCKKIYKGSIQIQLLWSWKFSWAHLAHLPELGLRYWDQRDWWLWLSLLCMSLQSNCKEGGLWPPSLQATCLHLLYCFWIPTALYPPRTVPVLIPPQAK